MTKATTLKFTVQEAAHILMEHAAQEDMLPRDNYHVRWVSEDSEITITCTPKYLTKQKS